MLLSSTSRHCGNFFKFCSHIWIPEDNLLVRVAQKIFYGKSDHEKLAVLFKDTKRSERNPFSTVLHLFKIGLQKVECEKTRPKTGSYLSELVGVVRASVTYSQNSLFLKLQLLFLAFLLAGLLVLPGFLSGFLWGLYITVNAFLYFFVEDFKNPNGDRESDAKEAVAQEICKKVQQNDGVLGDKVYTGWMCVLPQPYNPRTFHVNMLETVSVRLQGHMLHIIHHQNAARRYAFYEDPTLTEAEPAVTQVQICDLTNAKVKLRPLRLSARRWFSRKYPIMIKLAFDPAFKNSKDIESPSNELSNTEIVVEDVQCKGSAIVEGRRTIANILEVSNDAEEIDSKFEMEDEASCASEDLLVAAPSTQPKSSSSRIIWLFARAGREKEIWFHKLRKASKEYLCPTEKCDIANGISVQMPSVDKIKEHRDYYLYLLQDVEFNNQLNQIKDEAITRSDQNPANTVLMDLGYYQRTQFNSEKYTQLTSIFNLLALRVCYDFARDKYWVGRIREKVQMKIGAVHLPYFVDNLKLENFDLGTVVPSVLKIYAPMLDQWGIWLDYDIKYQGLVQLTIVTQVDLMKLNDESSLVEDDSTQASSYFGVSVKNPALAVPDTRYSDVDLPLSPEDEPDDADYGKEISEKKLEEKSKKKPGRKIMQFIDKITHSDLFKGASELKLVRKAMEEISDTRLVINVEITELEGTMLLNFPPPPSDRLWYGFRKTPQMSVKVVPQVGEKSVNFSAVSDLIQAKLVNIIENLLVFPNLDDFVVPLLSGNDLLHGSFTQ